MRDGDLGSGAESGSNSEAGFITEAQIFILNCPQGLCVRIWKFLQ
jgi:hypothetical protein